jgi:hypothetical protein
MTGVEHRQSEIVDEEVAADDLLIDAISRPAPHGVPPADDRAGGLLSLLLMAWRRQELDHRATVGDQHDNVVELASRRHRRRGTPRYRRP